MGIYILVFPGLFVGPMVSGNLHLFDTWVAAFATFSSTSVWPT